MTIEQIREEILKKRYHGIYKDIQHRTGLSLPTIRRYYHGDIYQKNAKTVLSTAYKLIKENEVGSSFGE